MDDHFPNIHALYLNLSFSFLFQLGGSLPPTFSIGTTGAQPPERDCVNDPSWGFIEQSTGRSINCEVRDALASNTLHFWISLFALMANVCRTHPTPPTRLDSHPKGHATHHARTHKEYTRLTQHNALRVCVCVHVCEEGGGGGGGGGE